MSGLKVIFTLILSTFICLPAFALSPPDQVVVQGVPEIPQQVVNRVDQYGQVRSAILADWAPDQGILISTRFGNTYQLHRVKQPGGARKQITFFKEPVYRGSYEPSGSYPGFLFSRDQGGNERYQNFFYNTQTGYSQIVTDGQSRNGSALWSNKGGKFAYRSTKRNNRDNDIYVASMANPQQAKMIFEAKGYWGPSDWSPDDQALLIFNYISANESSYHVLDIKSRQSAPIMPETNEKVSYGGAMWGKDGKGIYFSSDQDSEFQQLRYKNLQSGRIQNITKHIPWNISHFELSPNGQLLAFIANEDGVGKLHLLNTASWQELPLPALPIGQVSGIKFKPDGSALAFNLNTARSPSDVYSIDLKTNQLIRWTNSEVGGLNTSNYPEPKLIHYPSFDGRKVPAFYFKPNNPKFKAPYPVVIHIHGGPESQYRPFFSSSFQYWLNELGIAVLAPNVRGSRGYGKSYLKLDNGYKREDSVKDIGALLDWIDKQPELDSKRVGVKGGSYGGYMVLASMFHYNDRLKAGVDSVGISNFVTFLKNTKSYRRNLRRVEYGDERDPKMNQFLQSISPTNHAHKITKPLLVVQGLNDPRVPASEADQMVKTIKTKGGEVWYILAKNEGHGFRKKVNKDYYNYAVSYFWERYLIH